MSASSDGNWNSMLGSSMGLGLTGRASLVEQVLWGWQLPAMEDPFPFLTFAQRCQVWGGNMKLVVTVPVMGMGAGRCQNWVELKPIYVCMHVL